MKSTAHKPASTARTYQFTVEGQLDETWATWLGELELVSQHQDAGRSLTTLRGVMLDQAALRGVLNRLWDLNLVLCSVQQVNPAVNPPK